MRAINLSFFVLQLIVLATPSVKSTKEPALSSPVTTDLENELNRLLERYSGETDESKLRQEQATQDELVEQLEQQEETLLHFEKALMWKALTDQEILLERALEILQNVQDKSTLIQEKQQQLDLAHFRLELLEESQGWLLQRQRWLTEQALIFAQPLHRLAESLPDQQSTLENAQHFLQLAQEQEQLQDQLQTQLEQTLEVISPSISLEQQQEQLQLKYEQLQALYVKMKQRHAPLHEHLALVQDTFYKKFRAWSWDPDHLDELTNERQAQFAEVFKKRYYAHVQQQQRQQEQIEVAQQQLQLETLTTDRQAHLQQKLRQLKLRQQKDIEYFELRQEELFLRYRFSRRYVDYLIQRNDLEPQDAWLIMQPLTNFLKRSIEVATLLVEVQQPQRI